MKNKVKIQTVIIIIILIMLFSTCEKNNIIPEFRKNPRQYSWTMDTLSYPNSLQTIMRSIWGSSGNDVYTAGHNETTYGTMYHFDGKKWEVVKLTKSKGGTIDGPIYLQDIFGLAYNDIWSVGDRIDIVGSPGNYKVIHSNVIIHYDGISWKEVTLDKPFEYNSTEWLFSIWGNSPNNVYFSGRTNCFYHYNGSTLQKDSVPTFTSKSYYNIQGCLTGNKSNFLYFLGYSNTENPFTETRYFYIRKNNNWILKDTYTTRVGGYDSAYAFIKIWVSPGDKLYCVGYGGVLLWNGEKWEKKYDIGGSYSAFYNISGNSDDNLFAVGTGGKVCHYNGSDWYQFTQLADFNILYTGVWTNGEEVFIVGHFMDGIFIKTIILHGK